MAVLVKLTPSRTFINTGTLARLPLAGGAPREVLDNVSGGDWTPDGSDLAVIHGDGSDIEFPIGNVIYQPQGWTSHLRFSPRGNLLAFADHVNSGDDGRVVIVDRNGKLKIASNFYSSIQGVAWSPDGKEVWFTASPGGAARAVYAIDLSSKERLVLRVPAALSVQDIARNGRVLLTEDNAQIGIMALAPGSPSEKNLSWFDWSLLGDLSADGKVMTFSETGEAVGSKYGIYLRNTDGSPAVRLGDGTFSSLSPDGKWVAGIDLGSPSQIELLPTGAGQPHRLTNNNLEHLGVKWTPDGKALLFVASEPNHPPRSYWMDLDGKTKAITPEGTAGTLVTPDGKYLLARDRQHKYWLYPIQGGNPKEFPVSFGENERPIRFEPDGESMLVAIHGLPEKVVRVYLSNSRREDVIQISPADPAGLEAIQGVFLSSDHKSYAYSYYRVLSDLWVVDGLK